MWSRRLSWINLQSENVICLKPVLIHCIFHQQIHCGKSLNQSCVFNPVVLVVNYIRSHGLNHNQVYEFLSEIEAEYPHLSYHTVNLAVANFF